MKKKKEDESQALEISKSLEEKTIAIFREPKITPEVGDRLVEAAIQKIQGRRTDMLVSYIAATVQQVEFHRQTIEDHKRYLNFQERRLQAIHDGKFRIPNPSHPVPLFDEAELNG